MRNSRVIGLIFGAIAPFCSGLAQSQGSTADVAGLEEVVVTAERRAENLQEVPVTVTAVSSQQLVKAGVTDIMQLSNLVPSLSAIDPTGYTMVFIRGVGSSTLGAGTFASTATYVDGVYISRTTNNLFEFDGADGIQVLAGPQGSLYGRNATAGAVVINSGAPEVGSAMKGSLSARVGDYSNRSITGSISSGLGSNWAWGLTATKNDRDGFVKNLNPAGSLNTDDLDDRDSISARGTLVFEPNDTSKYVLRLSYNKSDDHSGGGYEPVGVRANTPNIAGFADTRAVFFGAFAGQIGVPAAAEVATNVAFTSRFGETYDNQRSGFTNGLLSGTHTPGSSLFIENIMASFNAEWSFDRFTLRSVTGLTDSDYHGSVQVSLERPGSAFTTQILPMGAPLVFNALGGLGFSSINPSKVISQGFQFLSRDDAKYKWIAGVDYSDEDGKAVLTGDTFGGSQYSADNDWSVQSAAAFAQISIPFGETLSFTLGGRYTDETYEINDKILPNPTTIPMGYTGATNVNTLPGVAPLPGRFRDKDSTKFTYTARLERKTDDLLWYGGVATGFKSATLNVNSPLQGSADPEEVKSYELGFKRDFGSRYRFNMSGFYADYEGIQLNVIVQATGANFLTNGPKAESKGVDLQWDARLTDNFQVSLGASFLDAKFVEDKPANPVTGTAPLLIKGNKLPGAANFAASLVGDYTWPLANGGSYNLVGTLVHNSGKYYEHLNLTGSGGVTNEPYSLLNLNVTYNAPNDKYSISLWGNNVTDEQYYRTGIVWAGSLGLDAIAGNPAHFGIAAKVNFGGDAPAPRETKPVDSDGDGVTDDIDRCPGTPAGTAVDASGCPLPKDSDGDGVMDPNDKCPNTPAGARVDANGCELDADGDGVVDRLDQCPNTPAGAKVDANGCELDSDGDGVVDSKDQCPDTPKGDRVDSYGCSFKTELKLPGVVFETNSAELKSESIPVLDGAVATLKRYPELIVEVAGHTDSDSSDAYNLALSKRRAETVMKYLTDNGATNSLKARGYGERQPVASNKTPEGKAQNRRVVLRILEK